MRNRHSISLRLCGLVTALAAAALFIWPLSARAERTAPPLRLGFTRSIFKNRNENDVLAALKVWAQTLGKERGISVDPNIVIYPSLDAALAALRIRELDGLTLLLSEYVDAPAGLLGGPFLRDVQGGTPNVEFVLLAKKGGNVSGVDDLGGLGITVHDNLEIGPGETWLAAQYIGAGHGRLADAVASLARCDKLSTTVLGVFFGKSDACLVSRHGFESMVELNPQVGAQLSVVAASPPIIPSVFAFRHDVAKINRSSLVKEIQRLHESVTGEQVLRVFKSERMIEVTAKEVAASVALLKGWRDATHVVGGGTP